MRDGLRTRLSTVERFEVVGEAGTAEEAMELLARIACDVVLTDVRLKRADGIDLTRSVIEHHPSVRVLVLSMYDEAEYVQQAMMAGARGYVVKDGPSNQILSALEAIAGGGTYLSPSIAHGLFGPKSTEKPLSAREQEILGHLGQGLSSKQIAATLNISVRTVESHRQNIKRKFYLSGQAELIKFAVERSRR
jgi:DNA-binding NarL/FixJ family response regulator